MPVCQICQKDNPSGAEYCEDCGAALTPQKTPVSTPAAPAGGAAGPVPAPDTTGSPAPVASGSPASAPSETPVPAEVASGMPIPAQETKPANGVSGADSLGAESSIVTEGEAEAPATPATPPASSPAPQAEDVEAKAAGPRARLVAMKFGAPTGDEMPLLGQKLVVGRFDPDTGPVDIDLTSASESVHISRQHGELVREPDGSWKVRDLGSTNGVFVKSATEASFGPRITAPRTLANGDEISFGNARFVFRND